MLNFVGDVGGPSLVVLVVSAGGTLSVGAWDGGLFIFCGEVGLVSLFFLRDLTGVFSVWVRRIL